MNKSITICTDFLNPKELEYVISLLQNYEVNYAASGGYDKSERKIILMGPFLETDKILEEYIILKITAGKKLSHPSILGSILGLGIDRKKVGDIVIQEDANYVVLKRAIASFVLHNLTKVGNSRVKIEEYHGILEMSDEVYREFNLILSSLRLDVFLSGALKLSRGKAENIIKKDQVKVNYGVENSKNKLLEPGDLISVRKYGRFRFIEELGISKKEKKIVKVGKLL